jgi:hypothetical protein
MSLNHTSSLIVDFRSSGLIGAVQPTATAPTHSAVPATLIFFELPQNFQTARLHAQEMEQHWELIESGTRASQTTAREMSMMRTAVLLGCCVIVSTSGAACSKAPAADDSPPSASGTGAVASTQPTAGKPASASTVPIAGTKSSPPPTGQSSNPNVGTGDVRDGTATAAVSGNGAPTPAGAGGTIPIAGAGAPSTDIADCPVLPSGMELGTARAVSVDAQKVIGTIRSLQGAHWDPGAASGALSKNYAAMGVDMIRTHDAGGVMGSGAGDVDGPGRSRMFPNMSADSAAEASYSFAATDALLKNITDLGAEIYFRVGRSNISGSNTVPDDFDKYADIVKHIVMHYNQGWANGFKYGIRYWEIWNEPDFTPFWLGTGEQYHELYGKIAMAIRSVEPTALIGGPANSTYNDKMKTRGSLMQYIKDNQLPLDFYSFHKYTNKSQDPMDYARMAQSFRDESTNTAFQMRRSSTRNGRRLYKEMSCSEARPDTQRLPLMR